MFWMLLYLLEQETGQTAAMSAVDRSPSSGNTLSMFVPSGTFPTFACGEQSECLHCAANGTAKCLHSEKPAQWNACTVKCLHSESLWKRNMRSSLQNHSPMRLTRSREHNIWVQQLIQRSCTDTRLRYGVSRNRSLDYSEALEVTQPRGQREPRDPSPG